MQVAIKKPDPPVFSYKFQGILNIGVFSELAVHTEIKMIIFTSGPLQGLSPFFVNFGYSPGEVAEMIDINQNLGFV